MTHWENHYWNLSHQFIAGCDEVGRGCLAGPVVAAAVILKPYSFIPEVDDSKKLSPKKRDQLFDVIRNEALYYGIGIISPEEIDQINILQASLKAMRVAIASLKQKPDMLLIDGNQGLKIDIPEHLLIQGDSKSLSIAAASIIAKVTRDRMMIELEKEYQQFKFSEHKGYGTKLHQEEIRKFGVLPIHRKTFEPVKSRWMVDSE